MYDYHFRDYARPVRLRPTRNQGGRKSSEHCRKVVSSGPVNYVMTVFGKASIEVRGLVLPTDPVNLGQSQ